MKKKWNQLTSLFLALVMVLSMALQVPMKAEAASTKSAFAGKVISIMGDSISTFDGYTPVSDGFNLEHRDRYPQSNLLTDVNKTWWKMVIDELGATLGINDSWAGSTVTNTKKGTSGDTGEKAAMASYTRIKNLGSNGRPDVILFYGGTNDIGRAEKMGTFSSAEAPSVNDADLWNATKWDSFAEAYATALARMKAMYPDAEILAMMPTYTEDYYTDAELIKGNNIIKAVCEHYGVAYVDLRNSGISISNLPDGIHPDGNGMKYIKNAVLNAMEEKLTVTAGASTVYSISHNLINATASLGYYKGVNAGSGFEETVKASSGTDLTVTVTMGDNDVTSEYYDAATGRITIPEVTANVNITAMGPFGLGEHLQAIPADAYAETNLWRALEPEDVYYKNDRDNQYNVADWNSSVKSVTVPVKENDKLYASSFGSKNTNGSGSNNGIRITYFKEDGTVITKQMADVYTEFSQNGYLTVPADVVAVNVPMWNADPNKVFKILTLANIADAEMITGKDATLKDDGTYSIDLSAFSTGNTLKETIVTPVPLDIIFVLDESSSMLQYEVKEHVTKEELSKVQSLKGLSKDDNLWTKLKPDEGYFLADGSWVLTPNGTGSSKVYSITIPVVPGDRIDATSFKNSSENGSNTSGIRVTFFDKDGKLLTSWSPAQVNEMYNDNADSKGNGYIVVPENAYAVCVPMWNNSTSNVVKNLDLIKDSDSNVYNPRNDLDLQNMRIAILQKQVDDFATQIYENAKETGADHQLSIVTFGGGIESTAPNQQGYFYKHVSANGLEDDYYGMNRPASEVTTITPGLYGYYYANTGLFVDGEFRNYYVGQSVKDGRTYAAVFDIDTTKTYYYVKYTDSNAGKTAAVTYKNGNWTDEDGVVVTPRRAPYDSNNNVQFLELKIKDVSHLTDDDYKNALESVVDSTTGVMSSDISKAVDSIVARGGTDTMFGMDMANNILAQNTAERDNTGVERKQIVILFTDGDTDNPTAEIVEYANQIKAKGAEIYSVGVGNIKEKDWLKQVSSDYDAAGNVVNSDNVYYKYSDDMDSLESFFTSITGDLTTSTPTTSLDENAVMEDVLADGFVLGKDFTMADISVTTQEISVVNGVFTEGETHTYTCGNATATSAVFTCADASAAENTLTVTYNKQTGKIGVTGFDYSENYVAEEHPGEKLMVTINRISVTGDVTADSLIDTNKASSGINYRNNNSVTSYPFEQPKTQVSSKLYVMDYAKELGVDSTEWNQAQLNAIDAVTDADKELSANVSVTSLQTSYGMVEKIDNNFLYTPKTMQWDAADTIYTFGKWDTIPDGVTTGENAWSKVSIVPANSIYYEDDFVTDTKAGTVGIEYTGAWTEDGIKDENITADSVTGEGNNSVHGWEDALADDIGYSGGSAHKVDFVTGQTASATFKFTGTGVDVYSRTNDKTGKVMAMLYKDGKIAASKVLSVDNLAESGDYYQIPTLSFAGLEYGTYSVKLIVGKSTDKDAEGNARVRTTYYLDGIRVYDPMNDDGLYAESEQKAVFTEVRDILLDKKSFDAGLAGVQGIVFIDEIPAVDENASDVIETITNDLGIYEEYGPKNEVYLREGQAIALKVDPEGTYYLGMKNPTANAVAGEDNKVVVEVTKGDEKEQIEISHSTDLYYKITPNSEGYIVVRNANELAVEGDAPTILSLTKLRTTKLGTAGVAEITAEEAVAQVFALRRMAVMEEEGVETLPPQEDASDDVVVDVENPSPDLDGSDAFAQALQIFVKKLFSNISGWLKGIRF